MKRFYCQCGTEVFFANTHCSQCGLQLGFVSERQAMFALTPSGEHWRLLGDELPLFGQGMDLFRSCEHRDGPLQCNWLIPADKPDNQCLSCATTRTVPLLDKQENWWRWRSLEAAKRHLLYSLLRLKLSLNPAYQGFESGLVFDFLEDQRSNPLVALEHIYTGHSDGVITVNVAEADSSYREATREAMNEPYRTLLGHFRHEIGHFYWQQLIENKSAYAEFRRFFGDDKQDYRTAVDRYYLHGPQDDWQEHYISAYASSHPIEDWAETWSHYLLMTDTTETALAYGLITRFDKDWQFDAWTAEWVQLVVILNALNRSTGTADAYPFVITSAVKDKLRFIHELIMSEHQV
jgi:hypothetical protein